MTRFIAALAVALAALSPAAAISAPAAEVRFCPAGVARTYPLDSLRGVQSLNLQNVAVLNTGAEPVEISALDIDLLRAGQVIDRRTLSDTDSDSLLVLDRVANRLTKIVAQIRKLSPPGQ